jgi:hypothetical protein
MTDVLLVEDYPIRRNASCVTKRRKWFSTYSLVVCFHDKYGLASFRPWDWGYESFDLMSNDSLIGEPRNSQGQGVQERNKFSHHFDYVVVTETSQRLCL